MRRNCVGRCGILARFGVLRCPNISLVVFRFGYARFHRDAAFDDFIGCFHRAMHISTRSNRSTIESSGCYVEFFARVANRGVIARVQL